MEDMLHSVVIPCWMWKLVPPFHAQNKTPNHGLGITSDLPRCRRMPEQFLCPLKLQELSCGILT